jgi:hypothetical protein
MHGTVGHILRAGPWEYMIRETFITITDLALGILSYAEIRAIFLRKIDSIDQFAKQTITVIMSQLHCFQLRIWSEEQNILLQHMHKK